MVKPDAAALAAFSMAESLVLALAERGLLSRQAIEGALEDAAVTHRHAATEGDSTDVNGRAAEAIERVKESLSCLERY
jgi:hypothetical protein